MPLVHLFRQLILLKYLLNVCSVLGAGKPAVNKIKSLLSRSSLSSREDGQTHFSCSSRGRDMALREPPEGSLLQSCGVRESSQRRNWP